MLSQRFGLIGITEAEIIIRPRQDNILRFKIMLMYDLNNASLRNAVV